MLEALDKYQIASLNTWNTNAVQYANIYKRLKT